ncbi:MAG: hypothetical protein RLZZ546_1667 [Bacteroidota bacterium]|jgi:hypothetical protein
MKKFYTTIVLFSFISLYRGFAQPYNSVAEVIQSVSKDEVLRAYDNYMIDLYKQKFKIPFVDEVNFRTETDRNNFARQEYALRAMFNGINESKYFSDEKNILINEKLYEKKKYINGVLYEKYKSLIKLKTCEEYLPIYKKIQNINASKLTHFIKIVSAGESNQAKEILKTEEEIYKLNVSIKDATEALKKWRDNLKVNDKFDFPPYISMENLLKSVDTSFTIISKSFEDKFQTEKSKNLNKFNQATASDKRILDYLQLRYSRRDNLLFQDEFSLGIGIRLPYSGNQAKSETKLAIAQKEVDLDNIKDKQKLLDDNLQIKNELHAIFEEIVFYRSSTQNIFRILNENHQSNKEDLNNIKSELQFSTELKMIGLQEKFYLKYLEYLFINLKLDPNIIWLIE